MKIAVEEGHSPVARALSLAASANAADDTWCRDYFALQPSDIDRLLTPIRATLGDLPVEVVVAPNRWDDVDVIVTRRFVIDRGLLSRCERLRLIQKLGRWPTGIDVAAAHAMGVAISCLPRRTLALTAEHAVLLMLASGKQLRLAEHMMAECDIDQYACPQDGVSYNWTGLSGLQGLHGQTIGLIGFGEVGRETAMCLRGFSAEVRYWSRHRAPDSVERRCDARWCDLDRLFHTARFLSIHLPFTTETDGWMSADRFRQLQPGTFFVNTSRGRIVDEQALYEALLTNQIAGAGLDVHAREPCEWDSLRQLPNVVVSPHVAGGDHSGIFDEARAVADNIVAVANGHLPKCFYRVEPEDRACRLW